jgi:hypothetical protein
MTILLLLCPILFIGGAFIASLGLGSHRRPEQRAWVTIGGLMMALGFLFGALGYVALSHLPGVV